MFFCKYIFFDKWYSNKLNIWINIEFYLKKYGSIKNKCKNLSIQCLENKTVYNPSSPIRPRTTANHDERMFPLRRLRDLSQYWPQTHSRPGGVPVYDPSINMRVKWAAPYASQVSICLLLLSSNFIIVISGRKWTTVDISCSPDPTYHSLLEKDDFPPSSHSYMRDVACLSLL